MGSRAVLVLVLSGLMSKRGIAGGGRWLEEFGARPRDRSPATAISDQRGRFRFAALPMGAYRITAAMPGFQPAQQS